MSGKSISSYLPSPAAEEEYGRRLLEDIFATTLPLILAGAFTVWAGDIESAKLQRNS